MVAGDYNKLKSLSDLNLAMTPELPLVCAFDMAYHAVESDPTCCSGGDV